MCSGGKLIYVTNWDESIVEGGQKDREVDRRPNLYIKALKALDWKNLKNRTNYPLAAK